MPLFVLEQYCLPSSTTLLIFEYIFSRVSSAHLHPPLPSISPSYGVRNFRGRVSHFNQSGARIQCFLASDWLKYETLPRKFRSLYFYTSSNFKLQASCTVRYFLLPLKTFSYLLEIQFFSLFSASSYPPTLIVPLFTSCISSCYEVAENLTFII